jgi:hypothetical protein
LSRIAVPVLFAVVSAATVYFLLYHFMPGGPGQQKREVIVNPPSGSAPTTDGTGGTTRPTPPSLVPAVPDIDPGTDGSTASPVETVQPSDMTEVKDHLRSFFGRRTLDERLAMSEPALPAEPLRGGILDGELPPTGELVSGSPQRNLLEDFVDFPFNIDFPIHGNDSGETRPITVIVRKRGDGEPKVLVNPLLDLAGGRLDEFVAKPVEGQQTFMAVIEAMPRCFEIGVPDAEKKFTYKLSASTRQSEIARAYASKNSPLAEQLYSPDSGIGWGRRIRATFVLEWNTSEDPEQPFIEMREIRALDWNS